MGPQHTFNSPHLPTLTFPYISPYLPHTPSHFPTPPFIPLPTSLLPPPTPQHIFLLSPHISLHLLKVWRSYHATKFLWRSYCGEVTMWRSYWQPNLKCCFGVGNVNFRCMKVWRSYHVAKLLWRSYLVAK